MKDRHVLIPMCGAGQRFKDVGYETYKPFIPVRGKTMVEWAISPYPASMTKILIVGDGVVDAHELTFLRQLPNVRVISIKAHKLGPAFSISQVFDDLQLDSEFFVSYSDVFWHWRYEEVSASLEDVDGAVLTWRKFHPHQIANNFSAFCRPARDDKHRLAGIREKAPYTDDWMTEPLSIGAFFFKSGHVMKEVIDGMIGEGQTVTGEYYPSVAFNRLVEEGKRVALLDVDFFVHWGTPEQLEDVLFWSNLDWQFPAKAPVFDQNVSCMAGSGSRMQDRDRPKALVDVLDQPLFEFVGRQFPANFTTCVVTDQLKAQILERDSRHDLVSIGMETSSQIETLFRAQKVLFRNQNFFLSSCDAFGEFSAIQLEAFQRETAADAIIFVFDPTLTQKKMSENHSHVVLGDQSRITAVDVKCQSAEFGGGLAGFFWFRDGRIFSHLEDVEVSDREPCIDDFLKLIVDMGYRVYGFQLDRYFHLGTAEEYQEFLFWHRFRDAFQRP